MQFNLKRIEDITDRLNSGKSVIEVAKEFNVTTSRIYHIINLYLTKEIKTKYAINSKTKKIAEYHELTEKGR